MNIEGKGLNKIILGVLGVVLLILSIYIIATIVKNNSETRRLEELSKEVRKKDKEEEKDIEDAAESENQKAIAEKSDNQVIQEVKALFENNEVGKGDVASSNTMSLKEGYILSKNNSSGETLKYTGITNASKIIFTDSGYRCDRTVYLTIVLSETGKVYINRIANPSYVNTEDKDSTARLKMYFTEIRLSEKAKDINMEIIDNENTCDKADIIITLESGNKVKLDYNVYTNGRNIFYFGSVIAK